MYSESSFEDTRLRWRTAFVVAATLILGTAFGPLFAQAPADRNPGQPAPGQPAAGQPSDGSDVEDIEAEKAPRIITEGKIPLKDILRFIEKDTGRIINFPSGLQPPQEFSEDVEIEVIGDIQEVTFEIVEQILQINGYELVEKPLEDGRKILEIRHVNQRIRPPGSDTGPIIDKYEDLPSDGEDQLATYVFQLKYADSNTVITALRELFDIQGAKTPTGTIAIVNLPQNQTLIIKSKVESLRLISELIKYIDVEVSGPEQVLQVRELNYADTVEMVDILQQALQSTGNTRNPAANAARRAAGGAAGGTTVGEGTTLIPDTRTQKIIIQSTNMNEVDLIHVLIDELDAKVRNTRSKTHVYKVRFLRAIDLRDVVTELIQGAQGSLRGGRSVRGNARGAANQAGANNAAVPSRIVAHEETNSLLIQAEPEEFDEIRDILDRIDRRRKQVFLEAALVQVTDESDLNYTLELLAGNLDDSATRIAALSSFGLTAPDVTQLPNELTRVFLPTAPTTGIVVGASNNGQLPVLLRAIKTDSNTKVLATPFILADDNQQNEIQVLNTIFFNELAQGQVTTQQNVDSEEAGIRLSLTPTISEDVVLIDLTLEVSDFASASSSAGNVPDRSENNLTSRVTIPDGGLFIIGGLVRESSGLVVDKVPILGDLPLIGRLFQSRGSSVSRNNLYVFLTAHILDEDNPRTLRNFTNQAQDRIMSFGEDARIGVFELPDKNMPEFEPPAENQ